MPSVSVVERVVLPPERGPAEHAVADAPYPVGHPQEMTFLEGGQHSFERTLKERLAEVGLPRAGR